MEWLTDVLLGALGAGVNLPTTVLLNVILGCTVLTLLLLLATSILTGNTALVPHVVVLLVLAVCLWVAINWFISQVGLVDARKQQEDLLGGTQNAADKQRPQTEDESMQSGVQPAAGQPANKKQQ